MPTPGALLRRYSWYYFQSAIVIAAFAAVSDQIPYWVAVAYYVVAFVGQGVVYLIIRSRENTGQRDPLISHVQAAFNVSLQIAFMFVAPTLFYYFIATLFVVFAYSATRLGRQEMIWGLGLTSIALGIAILTTGVESLPLETAAQRLVTVIASAMLLWRTSEIVIEMSVIRRRLNASTERLGQMIRVLFDQDVELKRHREELEQLVVERTTDLVSAMEQAEAANKAKTQFLANISHELRTPLNGILGAGEVLQSTLSDNAKRELADVVVGSGQSLLRLVNDVLDYSTLQSDGVTICEAAFDLRELLENTLHFFEKTVEDKPIRLTFEWPETAATVLVGDGGRIRQIVSNLLSNAIRFTESGEVGVRVIAPVAAGSLIWEVIVHDTGVGIPKEQFEAIFDAFSQVDYSTKRQYGGTGLGLAISRELAIRMGAELVPESRRETGSSLSLRIPLRAADTEISDETRYRPSPLVGAPEVLLVEDNEANQVVATRMLSLLGCNTTVANSGAAALALLATSRFAMALIDCQMPGMDGFELTDKIRSAEVEAVRSMPVIAVTAHAQEADKKRCLQAGMDDFLSKPYSLDDLQQKLSHWWRIAQENQT
ncbi:MAG: response regulator [Woeseiaceae bacterium]